MKKRRNDQSEQLTGNELLSATRARGIISLIVLLILFQIGVLIFNKCFRREKQSIESSQSPSKINGKRNNTLFVLFKFNPNTVSVDSLVMLGLSPKQAAVIEKYRRKGGVFRHKEDFSKIYSVSDKFYEKVKDFIIIPVEAPNTKFKERPRYVPYTTYKADSVKYTEREEVYENKNSAVRKRFEPVNINTADSAQLVSLYGIGPYFAKKILYYRERLGSFAFKEQLMEIKGFDEEKFNQIRDKIEINEGDILPFSLDTISLSFMKRHPYIGAFAAQGIMLLRKTGNKRGANNHITPEILLKERILDKDAVKKLMFYAE